MLQEERLQDMRRQLEEIAKDGTDLYLDGRRVSAAELAWTCCVNEDAVYMPDYVHDEDGRLTQLRYDRVKLR